MQWNQWDELGGSIFTSQYIEDARDYADLTCDECGKQHCNCADDDPRRYMGSDSDFSDHALGIDY